VHAGVAHALDEPSVEETRARRRAAAHAQVRVMEKEGVSLDVLLE